MNETLLDALAIFATVNSFELVANSRDALPHSGTIRKKVTFRSDPKGATQPRSAMVLINPALAPDKIAALLPTLTKRQAPSCYQLSDALDFRKIFAVGYTKTELNQQAKPRWARA